jgi:phosphoribosyl-ATP pyrophosphohydrolase/phosphoribosyl-AMP cyclohydrolase
MHLDFSKTNGLLPVIIQDAKTLQVLMLGYMNAEALEITLSQGIVTFYSRSKNRLWTKGETSGNFLKVVEIWNDCDNDAILISVDPEGPTCHRGTISCFDNDGCDSFLHRLEQTISDRIQMGDDSSYTNRIFKQGINKVAQKVGEEAVELIIESKDDQEDLFLGEAADLLFHFLILLQAKGLKLSDVEKVLRKRSKKEG